MLAQTVPGTPDGIVTVDGTSAAVRREVLELPEPGAEVVQNPQFGRPPIGAPRG